MPPGSARTVVTVAAGVAGWVRSQVSLCWSRTWAIASARAPASGCRGSAVAAASRAVPSARAYQATPCSHPVSACRGTVVAPSRSTAAPGPAQTKSSFGQPGVPGSLASITRTAPVRLNGAARTRRRGPSVRACQVREGRAAADIQPAGPAPGDRPAGMVRNGTGRIQPGAGREPAGQAPLTG